MKDKFEIRETVKGGVPKKPRLKELIGLKGVWDIEQTRKGVLIAKRQIHNVITKQGKNYILGAGFYNVTQIPTNSWYGSLINITGYTTGVSTNDTAASHGGWIEFVDYLESTRPLWGQALQQMRP